MVTVYFDQNLHVEEECRFMSFLRHDDSLHRGLCHNSVHESARRLLCLIVDWLSLALPCILILWGAEIVPSALAELSVMKCSGIIVQLSLKTTAKSLQRIHVTSDQNKFPYRTGRSLQEFSIHNAIHIDSIE
jgi:hypothetical protein